MKHVGASALVDTTTGHDVALPGSGDLRSVAAATVHNGWSRRTGVGRGMEGTRPAGSMVVRPVGRVAPGRRSDHPTVTNVMAECT